jgi:hypothetical protein
MTQLLHSQTLHSACEQELGRKCIWEAMTRLAVLREWPNVVCDECRKGMAQPRNPQWECPATS